MDECRLIRNAARRRPVPLAALLGATAVAGCTPSAPAVPFLGAFFPSWLLSAFAGIALAIVVRVIFVRIGLDDALPARLLVYIAVATIAGLAISNLVFGR